MAWIVISGVRPYDGRYQFDQRLDFTVREWGWIKRLAGYLPMNVDEGYDGADPELFAVFAVIVMRRAGKIEVGEVPDVFERLRDAPLGGTLRIEGDPSDGEPDEDDADPPPVASVNGSDATSGAASPTSSATLSSRPNPSGAPGSDSTVSAPAWSAS